MQLCATLQAVQRRYVKFDVENSDHLEAARLLCFEHKQHPYLRFEIEDPYQSVPSMMLHKIGLHQIETRLYDVRPEYDAGRKQPG